MYFFVNLHIFLFLYAVNYSSRKENRNRQKSVSAGQTSKKSESAKKIAIGAPLVETHLCF